jgi:hypothetical protein
MSRLLAMAAAAALVTFSVGTTLAADDTKVKSATRQVEEGAKTIGDGKVGTGASETAKGIGNTVVEGSKYAGDKMKESAKAAEPEAKTAWTHFKEGADAFGTSVKNFVTRLFSK